MPIKVRQKLGKYRIDRRLGEGGFAVVYEATDTIEGVRVALKIPHPDLVTDDLLARFRKEVRLSAQLNHPNILPLKNAEFVNGHFVVAFPLGVRSLADRLQSRMALSTCLELAEQMIEAVAYAHDHGVIHCDIKPENLLLFPENRLMLTDFGLAKMALKTINASGSGTVGYIAPEQAVGKPSFRSDVFSLGLVLYRMLGGQVPQWPYEWPPPGYERIRRRLHPDLVEVVRRAIRMDPRKRFADAGRMLAAFQRAKPKALRFNTRTRAAKRPSARNGSHRDWRLVRQAQFQRQFGKILDTRHACTKCDGPVSEAMQHCPWCGTNRKVHQGESRMPQHCPRCNRGLKADWIYCPWCYGRGFEVHSKRYYADKAYKGRCTNPKCTRKLLMPFMRYCPWCHRKVTRKWNVPGASDRCKSCSWGVVKAYWSFCPWCGDEL